MKKTEFLVQASLIAAIYAVITMAFVPISYGQIQVRVSEALTILPAFTPAAVPGLFIGCIVSNIYGGGGIIDIVFGSIATLLSAFISYKMPKKFLVPLPPVIINGIVVGYILNYLYGLPLLITMAWVTMGQLIACYGLGYPLMKILEKYENRIFRNDTSYGIYDEFPLIYSISSIIIAAIGFMLLLNLIEMNRILAIIIAAFGTYSLIRLIQHRD